MNVWVLSQVAGKRLLVSQNVNFSIFHSFVSFSTILCPRFFWANSFSKFSADIMKFLLRQIFLFISDLLFLKFYPLLKFTAMSTELHQRSTFDIFYQALFCSFTSSKNFVINVFPSAEGQFLWRGFAFLDKNRSFLEFPSIFRKIKSKRKVFRQSWTKHFQAFSHFGKISVQNKWMWVCVYELPN